MKRSVRLTQISASAALTIAAILAQTPPAAPPPAANQGKAGPSTAYQRAAGLPARITEFKAQETSIQAGQPATLVWATENPNTIAIDPDIGNVVTRGSRQVFPLKTTTYTLTVKGAANSVETKQVTITVSGTAPANAKSLGPKTETPRMADGKPDLSGVYNSSSFNFGGVAVRGQNDPFTGVLKPGAEKFKIVRGPNDPGQYSTCSPTGVPGAYFVPYQWQIVQGNDHIVIVYEYPHLFRVIPTDGTPHDADPDPTWMGDSVGHWEGDTLVVDTIAFNDKTELPGGFKHTEALHIIEKFHRTSFSNLDYEATIDDPNVFTKPWTISRGFPLRPELEKVDEFICENNHDYSKLFDKK